MVQDWSRESFPRHQSFSHACFSQDRQSERHSSFSDNRYNHVIPTQNDFHQERYQIGNQNGRSEGPNDLPSRPRPPDIDEALRRQIGVRIRRYFVAASLNDGTPCTFVSGGHKLPENVIPQFFDADMFQLVMNRLHAGANPLLDDSVKQDQPVFNRNVFRRSRPGDHRRSSAFGDWGSPARSGRKRSRPRNSLNEDEDTQMAASRRCIRIRDSDAVWGFYEQRFKNCHQTACKLIAKAWVKAVDPKKQSTHPYTGSDEKAPDWWPKPWGPTKNDKVRHKEPDHLYKEERVHLLAHILRIVMEPNGRQHPDIRKLGLNVTKLEETTAKALSSFFMNNDANARKKPFLTEIFKMARQQERYKLGEIDGSTEVHVMSEDKVPATSISENNEPGAIAKENKDVEPTVKPSTIKGAMHPSVCTDAANLSGLTRPENAFIGVLPMNDSQFQPPTMNDMAPQHSYVDNGAMQVHGQAGVSATGYNLTLDLVPSPHDVSRRPSVFSEFPGPGGTMYPQEWQVIFNGTNGSPMYARAAQQPNEETESFVLSGVPTDLNQPFTTAFLEEAQRPGHNAGRPSMFRWDAMAHAYIAQAAGYHCVTSDGRGIMPQVVDNGNRFSVH